MSCVPYWIISHSAENFSRVSDEQLVAILKVLGVTWSLGIRANQITNLEQLQPMAKRILKRANCFENQDVYRDLF